MAQCKIQCARLYGACLHPCHPLSFLAICLLSILLVRTVSPPKPLLYQGELWYGPKRQLFFPSLLLHLQYLYHTRIPLNDVIVVVHVINDPPLIGIT